MDRRLRAVAIASLVANVGIVLTGSAVRLTGSGLGCPSWPRCTERSYVAHGELGLHGVIEFGNRLLTVVVAVVAVVTLVVVWQARPVDRFGRRLALVLAVGVPAQAVLGGITVLTDLNPWVVAGHLLFSLALVAVSVTLLHHVSTRRAYAGASVPRALWSLVLGTYAAAWVVVGLGTVVTGSGPHAGDIDAPRTGLDPESVSQLHADFVFLLVGLTVGALLAVRAAGASDAVRRAALVLLVVELAQGAIGFVQYATDLPIALVELHLLGACATVVAATWLLLSAQATTPTCQPDEAATSR